MAKPNYQFERRQRDLAKKRKQEEKRQRKLAGKAQADDGVPEAPADPTAPEQPDASGPPPDDIGDPKT